MRSWLLNCNLVMPTNKICWFDAKCYSVCFMACFSTLDAISWYHFAAYAYNTHTHADICGWIRLDSHVMGSLLRIIWILKQKRVQRDLRNRFTLDFSAHFISLANGSIGGNEEIKRSSLNRQLPNLLRITQMRTQRVCVCVCLGYGIIANST